MPFIYIHYILHTCIHVYIQVYTYEHTVHICIYYTYLSLRLPIHRPIPTFLHTYRPTYTYLLTYRVLGSMTDQEDHVRGDRVHFYKTGIHGYDYINMDDWPMKTLSSLRESFNESEVGTECTTSLKQNKQTLIYYLIYLMSSAEKL